MSQTKGTINYVGVLLKARLHVALVVDKKLIRITFKL